MHDVARRPPARWVRAHPGRCGVVARSGEGARHPARHPSRMHRRCQAAAPTALLAAQARVPARHALDAGQPVRPPGCRPIPPRPRVASGAWYEVRL
eukprot:6108235-Prymnesium_polylepis.1